jgi:16S rRNA G966 N2-methylase RsmD
MAKEGLFNILENYVDFADIRALDLIAGTGNLSYELASRGCPDVTAVDNFRECTRFIIKTSELLQFPIRAITEDALRFVQKNPARWDLILADPPYDFEGHQASVESALTRLSGDGLLVLEHGSDTDLSSLPEFDELRRYGSVHFSFFRAQ